MSEHLELAAMPHNDDAERVLLGSMLLTPSGLRVLKRLVPESFYRRSHQLIHAAISALIDRTVEVDAVTVSDELIRMDALSEAGGFEYLDALTDGIPRTANVDYYADIVLAAARRRRSPCGAAARP